MATPQFTPEQLAEGVQRRPYFYAGPGGAVLCTTCVADAPDFEKHRAHYTATRLYMCGGCGVYLGPANVEEGAL